MKNGIARANPIANSSKVSPRQMIRGWELLLSSANVKLKPLLYCLIVKAVFSFAFIHSKVIGGFDKYRNHCCFPVLHLHRGLDALSVFEECVCDRERAILRETRQGHVLAFLCLRIGWAQHWFGNWLCKIQTTATKRTWKDFSADYRTNSKARLWIKQQY